MIWYVPRKTPKSFFHLFLEEDTKITCDFTFLRLIRFQLREQSLIVQRQVCDYVHHCGGVEHDITNSMSQYVRNANKRKVEKRRVQEEIKELQSKKA
ncbi:hypothetical protein PR048_024788 [Dryococelus australis]|uniref:Uncharacterized protein n=1 Tax=Dryococelus australis TaxID=614101 RepID=A0ABQ9GPJ9_9NEOP|nr:hypothetical protein PR048_024788 [Dryococelus australis]